MGDKDGLSEYLLCSRKEEIEDVRAKVKQSRYRPGVAQRVPGS
jgi:hypothetical protein